MLCHQLHLSSISLVVCWMGKGCLFQRSGMLRQFSKKNEDHALAKLVSNLVKDALESNKRNSNTIRNITSISMTNNYLGENRIFKNSSKSPSSNFSGEKSVGFFGWMFPLSCRGLIHGLSGLKCFKSCIQPWPNYFTCQWNTLIITNTKSDHFSMTNIIIKSETKSETRKLCSNNFIKKDQI